MRSEILQVSIPAAGLWVHAAPAVFAKVHGDASDVAGILKF